MKINMVRKGIKTSPQTLNLHTSNPLFLRIDQRERVSPHKIWGLKIVFVIFMKRITNQGECTPLFIEEGRGRRQKLRA